VLAHPLEAVSPREVPVVKAALAVLAGDSIDGQPRLRVMKWMTGWDVEDAYEHLLSDAPRRQARLPMWPEKPFVLFLGETNSVLGCYIVAPLRDGTGYETVPMSAFHDADGFYVKGYLGRTGEPKGMWACELPYSASFFLTRVLDVFYEFMGMAREKEALENE